MLQSDPGPEILDTTIYDEVIDASLEDSVRTSGALGTREGILGGISSGAIVWAALQLARRPENAGKLIVAIVCDFGERHLSPGLFDEVSVRRGAGHGSRSSSRHRCIPRPSEQSGRLSRRSGCRCS